MHTKVNTKTEQNFFLDLHLWAFQEPGPELLRAP